MENNLKKFENDVFGDLNTVVINEEIWLNANDVCRALGYSNPRDALARHVDGDDLVKHEGVAMCRETRGMGSYKIKCLLFLHVTNPSVCEDRWVF